MTGNPTRTGLVSTSCRKPDGVIELKLSHLIRFCCPACNHCWSVAPPARQHSVSSPSPTVRTNRCGARESNGARGSACQIDIKGGGTSRHYACRAAGFHWDALQENVQ